MRDETLRLELLELEADDDRMREHLAQDGSLFEGYSGEMEAVHRKNAARLGEIIDQHGWPGRSLVGEDGASAAWRILQHAIAEPALLRRCLPLLEEAAGRGDVERSHVAMLVDRVCTLEGRPQRYGTQYDWNEDATAMVPIGEVEDPASIDARRSAVGLPPMKWKLPPDPRNPRPADIEARRAEMIAWARRVGWRDG